MTRVTSNKPIRIKAGRGVHAKLWKNRNRNGEWYNITISRVYRNDAGEFHNSESFSRDDLLQVAYVAQKAFERISDDTYETLRD